MGDEAEYLTNGDYYAYQFKPKEQSKPAMGGKYKCTSCVQYKSKSEYYKDKRVSCGIRSRCKTCYKIERKVKYEHS